MTPCNRETMLQRGLRHLQNAQHSNRGPAFSASPLRSERNPAEMKPTRCTCGIRPTADQASYVGARRTAEGTDMKCRQTVSKQRREIVNIGWCTMWAGIRPALTEKDGWLAGRHASSAADVNKRRPLRGLSVPRHLTCQGDDSAAGWMYLGAGQFPYRSNRAGG